MVRLKTIVARGLIAGSVVIGAVLISAPYLPRLAQEGYPQLVWPAPGFFAKVSSGQNEHKDKPLPQNKKILSKLNAWSETLFTQKGGKALLVFHEGNLVVEHYAKGFDRESRFNSYSMVKSLVGVLTLKAVADKKIGRLSDPIGQYLPQIKNKKLAAIPIKNFLTMSSGIVFEPQGYKAVFGGHGKDINQSRYNPFGPMVRLHMNGLDDIIEDLVTKSDERGKYNYQNINTALLGKVLVKIYGKPLEQVLAEKIWQPAQHWAGHSIKAAYWRRYDKDKAVTPYCCLYARPIDWALVTHYLMANGNYGCIQSSASYQRQFLPQKLWQFYMGANISETSFHGVGRYGAQIYHNILDRKGEALQGKFTYMFGSRGQTIYMMPKKNLIVVRFGEKIQLLHSTLYAAWGMIKS